MSEGGTPRLSGSIPRREAATESTTTRKVAFELANREEPAIGLALAGQHCIERHIASIS